MYVCMYVGRCVGRYVGRYVHMYVHMHVCMVIHGAYIRMFMHALYRCVYVCTQFCRVCATLHVLREITGSQEPPWRCWRHCRCGGSGGGFARVCLPSQYAADAGRLEIDPPTPNQGRKEKQQKSNYVHAPTLGSLLNPIRARVACRGSLSTVPGCLLSSLVHIVGCQAWALTW